MSRICIAAFACALCASRAASAVETVVVTASPLSATAVDPDTIPGAVETLSVEDLSRDRPGDVLPNLVATALPDVSLNDEQGSPFQPDFVYRGFEASPIAGVAEGIAVYQNGVRLNETFGDSMNWDLVPEFAVRSVTLQSSNPVFGLNAIGGAVSLAMKDGFQDAGTRAQVSGGSFGNVAGDVEYGARFGNVAVYAGAGAQHSDGFRDNSPATLRQAYADIGYEDGNSTLHLSIAAAHNDIAAAGPTPVALLAQDPRSVFTLPQSMINTMELAQLHGSTVLGGDWHLSGSAYYRHFAQRLTDGNTTDVQVCSNDPAQFCLEGHGDYPDDALFDSAGNPVSTSALPAGATPGEIDHTHTDTQSYGVAAEIASSAALFDHANTFVLGASLDRGDTSYTADGELGTLLPNLRVVGSGIVIDQSGNPAASPPREEPVSVGAANTYYGVYASDAFVLVPGLIWTVSGRLNIADVGLTDRLGTNLDGRHGFSRFNPGAGLTYKLAPEATFYSGYSESNRAPTAGELSCADPASPCLLDAFLVSDPALKQVVARNYEAGLRGGMQALGGRFTWSLGLYRTEVARDILLLATDVNGFGFFQNAGTTRHQGLDAKLGYRTGRWRVDLAYSYLEATFRDPLTLTSNSPGADANGFIHVAPGDRLPLMPAHRLTFGGDYDFTPELSLGGDLRLQSGVFLAGDAANQEPKLPGFTTVDLHASYALRDGFVLFGGVENLFDRRYYTYGTFTRLDGLPPNVNLSNPRSYSPSAPRTFYGGIRLAL
jgi:iron complex outermembrane receptor protein